MTYGTMAARGAVQGMCVAQPAALFLQDIGAGIANIVLEYLLFLGFEALAIRKGTLEEY